ncbi:Myosin heavy chain, non-muscle AltName: Full=Myosin II; AltName: Full=Non-muscle MHC; AltName: Full=Zipper protein [Serendipita indica DSM 11827]|nr:Myosin heavy chain, non-muscle AltName: Full=Myosin II; AltName: Full=Non-muscle MHC; AltName: Full=Zipper protein [Serendipita indica DSM 11827]
MPRYSQNADAARAAAEQAEFNEKKWVWVPDEENGYIAGWVIEENEESAEVVMAAGGDTRTISLNALSKMNPPKFDRVDDIADLTFLNEASVVHNLRLRYLSGAIYTYSGLFLVAINPYTQLPLYTDAIIEQYRNKRRDENAPHIFAIAERAWMSMGEERENQSILITGESGAGKTENTKKVIQYLAAIATENHTTPPHSRTSSTVTPSNSNPSGFNVPNSGLPRGPAHKHKSSQSITAPPAKSKGKLGLLERQILQANPILEAFGNAQTARNNNSSRFGKFVRISFSPEGSIAGANIDWYLLEKSRVVVRSDVERNFHVFYQLLEGGGPLLATLLLDGDVDSYEYLNKSRREIDGINDREEWRLLQNALDVVGFTPNEQLDLFRIIAAILHIGNIDISADRTDQAQIRVPAQAEKVCHLLGISVQEFTKAVLRPRVLAGREWVTQARTRQQALDELSALCKTLYEKSFGALVDRINRALDRPSSKSSFIGVLDIAGFEIFETNGFEQLCINYTNEKLQQFFNHHMFVLEQEEYRRERIEWEFVNFGLDLQPTIDLIESSGSVIGILSCLDEECIMPRATDATFTHKLNMLWTTDTPGEEPHPGKAKYAPNRFEQGFTVQHYAGRVEYRTEGWLEKNKDPLNENLTRVLASSSEKYIAGLFSEYSEGGGTDGSRKRILKKGAFRTVGQRHKEQLNNLMSQLQATQPHFVRCIVPNPYKRPGRVDVPLVLDQLRCNGVLEGIRIARLGYPNRLPFVEFRYRYEILTPGIIPRGYMDGRKACLRMVDALELDRAVFKIGTSKIFFKAGVLAELEERRDGILFDIFSRIQAVARMWTARRQMRKILNRAVAIRTIQRNARMYGDLKEWPWWQLYTKVRPLLTATRNEEELRRKETELTLAKERAERDKQEREALQKLKMELESEKRKVEEQLEAERALGLEKDRLLERSKKQESDLTDDVIALQLDLETVDGQLDRAMKLQKETDEKYKATLLKYEEAAFNLSNLESSAASWRQREDELTASIQRAEGEVTNLTIAQETLKKTQADLQQKLVEKDQDITRVRERLEANVRELESKISQETGSKDILRGKIESLEEENRQINLQMSELSRTATEYSTMLQKKEAEISRLTSELFALKKERDQLSQQSSKLEHEIASVLGELEALKASQKGDMQARENLQHELDELRTMMAAKASEDSKLREVERSKEQELTSLRSQVNKLQRDVSEARSQASEAQSKLKSETESAQRQLRELERSQKSIKEQKSANEAKLAEVEASLADLAKSKRVAETELQAVRARQLDLDTQLEEAITEKESLQRQLAAAQSKQQEYEDTVLQIEREKATWTREMESMKTRLESESNRRAHLEKNATGRNTEAARLRERVAKMEKDMVNLQKDIGDRDWQIKQLKSKASQDKTTVEHVYVLQEAKRVTDLQLEEAKRELERERTRIKTLETTKARLISEAEDAAYQHQQELVAIRSSDKHSQVLEQKAAKALANLEREKSIRETAEMQSKRLESELESMRSQMADLEQSLHTAERTREHMETEIATLAANGDSAESMKKMRRDYEARITQLESQIEDSEIVRVTAERIKQKVDQQHAELRRLVASSGIRDTFRERIMKEIQAVDDAIAAEIVSKTPRHVKRNSVQTFANIAPQKRFSVSISGPSNGQPKDRRDSPSLERPRTPDKSTTQLKQQVQSLELRIVASDRVRQHLEATLHSLTTDLERSDGSKQSLQAHRAKIARENAKLVDLLHQESEARRATEASQTDGINAMWKKFQTTIDSERANYSRLEESRKSLMAQQKVSQVEMDELKRSVAEMHQIRRQLTNEIHELQGRLEAEQKAKATESTARRRLQEQLQELQASSAASSSLQGGMSQAAETYKAKADAYLAKLEAAEIARAKASHQESLTRKSLAEAEKARDVAETARQAMEQRLNEAEQRITELSNRLEEESREYTDMEVFRRRLKEEMEDERDQHQKDLAERDFTIDQTRQKYQAELLQLSEESRHLRDNISHLREENHKMRSELDELQLRYDDEQYSSSGWKKEKERMSAKIMDLTGAYESSKMAQAEQQTQIVALLSQVRELRALLDDAEAERAALRQARMQLESRLSDIAQDHLDTSRLSSDRVLQELNLEKQDLRAQLEEQADRVALANEKLKKAEGFASEAQIELSKVRHTNSELEKENATLKNTNKELNVRIVEYETKAYANAPRPSTTRRQEMRIEELQNRLAQEERERTEASKLHRTADKNARELNFQLTESNRHRLRLEEELKGAEQKIEGLRVEFNELLKSESALKVSKRRAELEAQEYRQKHLNAQRELETLRGRLDRSPRK